jgi:hypothetical protein
MGSAVSSCPSEIGHGTSLSSRPNCRGVFSLVSSLEASQSNFNLTCMIGLHAFVKARYYSMIGQKRNFNTIAFAYL